MLLIYLIVGEGSENILRVLVNGQRGAKMHHHQQQQHQGYG